MLYCLETPFAQRFLEPFWFQKSGCSRSSECDCWFFRSGFTVGAQFDILRRLPALVFEGVCECSGPPSEHSDNSTPRLACYLVVNNSPCIAAGR